MPFMLNVGVLMLLVLLFLLISVFLNPTYSNSKKPFFRLVLAGSKYIIQYRKYFGRWDTYTLPNSGEPAVYYTKGEAEEMIETLVERRRRTNDLNKIATRKVEIFEYDTDGKQVNTKERWF